MRGIAAVFVIVLTACTAAPAEESPSDGPRSGVASVRPSPSVDGSRSAAASSPIPADPSAAPQLFGTWRTTLVGTTVTLTLREEGTYRIHRGVNVGTGEISVDGDRIDFFNSTLCRGTGEYRWQIEGDSLRFSSLAEPCPGRAEALLNLRYSDYSPPS